MSERRLFYFRADGCGVCVAKHPVAEEIARTAGIPFEVVDVSEPAGEREAEALRIRTVPTLALVRGERVPFRLVGRMITPENAMRLLWMSGEASSI